jgi:hypothetical protein
LRNPRRPRVARPHLIEASQQLLTDVKRNLWAA